MIRIMAMALSLSFPTLDRMLSSCLMTFFNGRPPHPTRRPR